MSNVDMQGATATEHQEDPVDAGTSFEKEGVKATENQEEPAVAGSSFEKDGVKATENQEEPLVAKGSFEVEGAKATENQENSDAAGSYGVILTVIVYLVLGCLLIVNYVVCVLMMNDMYPGAEGGAMRLWGTVTLPEMRWLFNLYHVSILGATLGFFPAFIYALRVAAHLSKRGVHLINGPFAAFMLNSQIWLPMCVVFLEVQQDWAYWVVKLNLLVSGLCGVAWFYAVYLTEDNVAAPGLRIAGKVGTFLFAFHCMVFDGIFWAPFFHAGLNCDRCEWWGPDSTVEAVMTEAANSTLQM